MRWAITERCEEQISASLFPKYAAATFFVKHARCRAFVPLMLFTTACSAKSRRMPSGIEAIEGAALKSLSWMSEASSSSWMIFSQTRALLSRKIEEANGVIEPDEILIVAANLANADLGGSCHSSSKIDCF